MRAPNFFLVAIVAGCGADNNSDVWKAPSGSTVNIEPSTSEVLKPGQKVSLKVKAAYALSADSGTLGLVVQDASNSSLTQTMNVVLRGNGNEELAVEFIVPDTKAIQVFVPLSGQGQSKTSTVFGRAYKVRAP